MNSVEVSKAVRYVFSHYVASYCSVKTIVTWARINKECYQELIGKFKGLCNRDVDFTWEKEINPSLEFFQFIDGYRQFVVAMNLFRRNSYLFNKYSTGFMFLNMDNDNHSKILSLTNSEYKNSFVNEDPVFQQLLIGKSKLVRLPESKCMENTISRGHRSVRLHFIAHFIDTTMALLSFSKGIVMTLTQKDLFRRLLGLLMFTCSSIYLFKEHHYVAKYLLCSLNTGEFSSKALKSGGRHGRMLSCLSMLTLFCYLSVKPKKELMHCFF